MNKPRLTDDLPPEGLSPAERWEMEATTRALDELFSQVKQYKSSKSYEELIRFVSRFPFYSPYNAMLVHLQMSGAKFVAPAHRWISDYGRFIKPNARPLVILQPMGPVMFVFDVSETEPGPDAKPLPPEVEKPFEARGGKVGYSLEQTIDNAKRDGIRITLASEGSQSAGSIREVPSKLSNQFLLFQTGRDQRGDPVYASIPVRYDLVVNKQLSREAQYATVIHELAHLYCGHMGTPNTKWWPNRSGLLHVVEEIEAESIAFLICKRLGIDIPSGEYLSGYFKSNDEAPNISIDCVLKASGLIEQMGKLRLKERSISEQKKLPKRVQIEEGPKSQADNIGPLFGKTLL